MLADWLEGQREQPDRLLVLDAGAVTRLSERSRRTVTLIAALQDEGLWPPVVPSPVLIESLCGDGARDAAANLMLKTCEIVEDISERWARRAALLRTRARRGSAIDALVVAVAEPGGVVLTLDPDDLKQLAAYARDVVVESL